MASPILKRITQFISIQLSKTARQPSRLFLGPVSRCIRALLRWPPLVPIILPALPERLIKKAGLESIYLVAGYELLQRDWPEEAWLCLQRYLRQKRPSIDELLLGANCLYQGLGRCRDAMALLAQANQRELQEATSTRLPNLSFRVLDSVWARHIGHLGILDYVLKRGILEGRRRDDTILYLPSGSPIANQFLFDQVAAHLRLIQNPIDLPFPASDVQLLHYDLLAPRLPNQTTAYYWNLAAETYAQWHREGRAPLFVFPPEMEARGWAALEEAGVPRGAWFVALHVREREPDGRQSGINAIRNANVSDYFLAIAEISRRGGWVIRIGDTSMTPLPALPHVVDYCHSTIRADWMDIFMLACCRFMIGTNSGPAFVPALYGTPTVLTNWWPAAERPWHSSDIFVPKLLRRLSDGRYLTLSETLCEPFGWCYSRRYLAERAGLQPQDNDPEMIRTAVKEMLARLDGDLEADADASELRARADRIYQSRGVAGMGQLAREFLRCHHDLIV